MYLREIGVYTKLNNGSSILAFFNSLLSKLAVFYDISCTPDKDF